MSSHQKTVNYARALFHVKGSLEEVHQRQKDLELLADVIKQNPKMLYLLGCPELSVDAKLAALEDALKIELEPFVKRLIILLLKRRKATQIRQVASEYHKLVIHSLKEMDVDIVTAEPLTDQAKQLVRDKLEHKLQQKVNLIETIDPTLLGGFILFIHNQMLDLSIKGHLMNLKKAIVVG